MPIQCAQNGFERCCDDIAIDADTEPRHTLFDTRFDITGRTGVCTHTDGMFVIIHNAYRNTETVDKRRDRAIA